MTEEKCKYNVRNPSVKRILQEVKEMQSNPSDDFMSLPLEDNIFEWQFAIRGPRDTEFEGGIYHGRIQLPAEYPLKPPAFMLLTPNGRFETQTKICLSISNYHPEHWQPSWSVRTALVALIAFMPTNPDGALGSLDYKKEERHLLAIKSRESAPKFGTPERQKLIDEIHQYMLSKALPIRQLVPPKPSIDDSISTDDAAQRVEDDNHSNAPPTNEQQTSDLQPRIVENVHEVQVNERVSFAARFNLSKDMPVAGPSELQHRIKTKDRKHVDDQLYTLAAIGLTLAIAFLLIKKVMKVNGYTI